MEQISKLKGREVGEGDRSFLTAGWTPVMKNPGSPPEYKGKLSGTKGNFWRAMAMFHLSLYFWFWAQYQTPSKYLINNW